MFAASRATPSKMPARLEKVPAFPSVAMKLLSVLSDEETDLSNIAACIAADPALSGRLMERANAADLASYCEARTVLQAIVALGLDRTRQLSLALATLGYARSKVKPELLRPCWRHTVACALIAADLARQCGLRPAEAYTAALMHDIGRLGLLTAYSSEYEAILALAEGQPADLILAEREVFGVDHVEAGAWLAREWGLPECIIDVIARHHQPSKPALDQVAVVQIACRLADSLGFAVHRCPQPPGFDEVAGSLPPWIRSRLAAELPALKAAIAKEIRLFEDSAASPEEPKDEATAAQEDFPTGSATPPDNSHSNGWMVGAICTVTAVVALTAWILLLR